MKALIKFTPIALLVLFISSCMNSHVYKGDRYYDAIAYSKAIPHYEKIYSKKSNSEYGLKLADSYFKVGNYLKAEEVYAEVFKRTPNKDLPYFNYAKSLMANGKYEEAKVVLKEYLVNHKGDPVAQVLLNSCNSIDDRFRDTTLYVLNPINTEGFTNAFSVTEYQNGIVFSGDKEVYIGKKKNPWTGDSYLDLYEMEKSEDGTWMDPKLLSGDVNGPFHEGPASFSSDGETVYFTRSNYYKRKMDVNEKMENNLKIFRASLIDGKWKNLEELPFNSDDYSSGHPALTPCCHTLYFVSDMPGGFGGTDLYRVDYNDGVWSKPENLGAEVNTSGNEMFPYYDEDGALYFSSDAHNSMGGLDVFVTYFNGERWMEPENLNYPINSIKDDFGFVLDKDNNTGFVSSSRSDNDKIYEFSKHAPKFNLFGFAHVKGTQTPVAGVTVEITDATTHEVVAAESDKDGRFKIKLKPETSYELLCTKKGCFTRTDQIKTADLKYSTDFYADFEVEEIILNKPIVLENIYYDFDKWNIRKDAALELDKLVKLLNDNPTIEIELGSHTDVRGSAKYNQLLSGRRAMAAVYYLIHQGIDAKRLTWKGYGETVLVNECKEGVICAEKKHQENRRTEFKVTKM